MNFQDPVKAVLHTNLNKYEGYPTQFVTWVSWTRNTSYKLTGEFIGVLERDGRKPFSTWMALFFSDFVGG